MKLRDKNNLYYVAMYKMFMEEEKTILADNGDIFLIRVADKKMKNHRKEEVPTMMMQLECTNLEGNSTYIGRYFKALEPGQKVEDIYNMTDLEKIDFIFKKEKGLFSNSYHYKEKENSYLSEGSISYLEFARNRVLEAMQKTIDQYNMDEKVKKYE